MTSDMVGDSEGVRVGIGGIGGSRPSRIVVVDDHPANVQVASAMLLADGFDVRFATSGQGGLDVVRSCRPDVVLLDVGMPDMSGYEVCRRLKRDPATRRIPVIFVTALDAATQIADAFEAGGADFIGKPFQPDEMRARIAHQIRTARLEAEAADASRRLRELVHLNGDIAAMLVHDLRSPLAVIRLSLEAIRASDRLEVDELVDASIWSVDKVQRLVGDVLETYRCASGSSRVRTQCDLGALLQRCLDFARVEAKFKDVTIHARVAPELPRIDGDPRMVERGISNLLCNAVKFTAGRGQVWLSADVDEEGAAVIRVADDGSGIPDEDLPFVFDLQRANSSERMQGSGLALGVAQRAIHALGGSIELTSHVGHGTVFTVTIPGHIPS